MAAPSAKRHRPLGRVQALVTVYAVLACNPETEGAHDASGTTGVVLGSCAEAECQHFPEHPITLGPVPKDAELLFAGDASANEGACLVEPPDGAMLPNNWLPPRIRFEPSDGENLWQIRLQAKNERNDLVVYTTRPAWTMSRSMWETLALNPDGSTIDVRVRGVDTRNPARVSETTSSFHIAPVSAGGSIVYWAADGSYNVGGETKLVGFRIGDSGTIDALRVADVEEFPALDKDGLPKKADDFGKEGEVRCIGCHTSTPDGEAVAFVDNWPWNSVLASVKEGSVGKRPGYVSAAVARVLQLPWQGTPTFSAQYWKEDVRIMVQSFGNDAAAGWSEASKNATGADRLIWFDLTFEAELPVAGPELNEAVSALEGVAYGFIEREDDPRGAVNPSWSHNGKTIAYVSASATLDGHAGGRTASDVVYTDIYLVPYENGEGGKATPLAGASDLDAGEYYPDYSADDRLIAFTRAESVMGPVYYRPDGEIWVVPADGDDSTRPTRLTANDPPQCTGEVSPGVTNSWPKWAPDVQKGPDGKHYYWLIFSSARAFPGQITLPRDSYSPAITKSSQLYIAAVVRDGNELQTYPAIYLYNQTTNTTNLTPAWDEFQIPESEVR